MTACATPTTPPPACEPTTIPDSLFMSRYPFVNLAADTIFDPSGAMNPVWEQLRLLDGPTAATDSATAMPLRFDILHFGDSHIQGGASPRVVMTHLQKRFGNAGRGMVVPHRMSRSNEYRDYSIRSSSAWEPSRLVDRSPDVTLGITGVALRPAKPTNRITIRTLVLPEDSATDYRFNHIRVFHDRYAPIIEAPDTINADVSITGQVWDCLTEIELTEAVDSIDLVTSPDGRFSGGAIYGFSLENNRSGVLYHAMGVNSACFLHWGRAMPNVAEQSIPLDAELIIISLGSNEASGYNFNDEVFMREIDRMVVPLRDANPRAAVLLTSPVGAFRRGVPNRNYGRVSGVLRRYAEQRGVAYIDLYNIAGGDNAAQVWEQAGLFARDKIHFTADGYRLQGLLIYNALTRNLTRN